LRGEGGIVTMHVVRNWNPTPISPASAPFDQVDRA
jgi:hypothetical protein